jgi:hypothetical protein
MSVPSCCVVGGEEGKGAAELVAIIPLQIAPRSRLILRPCEAFVRSRSVVKSHVRTNFGITRFEPQPHRRIFLPRDDKRHEAKSTA